MFISLSFRDSINDFNQSNKSRINLQMDSVNTMTHAFSKIFLLFPIIHSNVWCVFGVIKSHWNNTHNQFDVMWWWLDGTQNGQNWIIRFGFGACDTNLFIFFIMIIYALCLQWTFQVESVRVESEKKIPCYAISLIL